MLLLWPYGWMDGSIGAAAAERFMVHIARPANIVIEDRGVD
jgi:hypothetical protein